MASKDADGPGNDSDLAQRSSCRQWTAVGAPPSGITLQHQVLSQAHERLASVQLQSYPLYSPPPLPPPPPPPSNQCYTRPNNSTGLCFCVPRTTFVLQQQEQEEQVTSTQGSCQYLAPYPTHPTTHPGIPNPMDLEGVPYAALPPLQSSSATLFPELPDLEPTLPPTPHDHPPPLIHDIQLSITSPLESPSVSAISSWSAPSQAVPELSPDSENGSNIESSSSKGESETLANDTAVPTALRVNVHGASLVPLDKFIPASSPFPGDYGFKLLFAEAHNASKPWTFSKPLQTLFIKPGVDFAVTFTFDTPPPPQCFVRALVCYGDPLHVQKLGPITNCVRCHDKDSTDKHSDHFILCKVPQAIYADFFSHRCVTVPLDALPVSEHGSFGVYSYACYTTHIVGTGKNKPSLKTIFSLICNGNEIGRDVITIKSCACPLRDLQKELNSGAGRPRPRRRRQVPAISNAVPNEGNIPPLPTLPELNLVSNEEPDEDGCYNFTWRVPDPGIYNLLVMLRTGYELQVERRRGEE